MKFAGRTLATGLPIPCALLQYSTPNLGDTEVMFIVASNQLVQIRNTLTYAMEMNDVWALETLCRILDIAIKRTRYHPSSRKTLQKHDGEIICYATGGH